MTKVDINQHPTRSTIAQNFSRAPSHYHQHAEVQQEVASRLIASLEPWINIIPPGPIIELGCGTGFVSQQLSKLFSGRAIQITDISSQMLENCRQRMEENENISYKVLDAHQIPAEEPTYGLSIHSFVAQWIKDPALKMGQWLEVTKPGGLLLAAFPGNESFPEWKKYAEELGLPFTGNPLPDTEEMVIKLSSDITQVDYYEDTIVQEFKSAADFFRHLKQIGAGTQQQGRHLTAKEMKLLIDHWDEQTDGNIQVSYHIIFLAVKREY